MAKRDCGFYTPAMLLAAYLVGLRTRSNLCPYRSRSGLAKAWRDGFKDRTESDTGWERTACNYRVTAREIG